VIVVSLLLLGVGSIGAAYVQSLWHVCVTTGFFMALGAGGVSMTTGSTIAARWFETRRGVAIGLTAGGMSAGQLVMVPLAMALTLWFVTVRTIRATFPAFQDLDRVRTQPEGGEHADRHTPTHDADVEQ